MFPIIAAGLVGVVIFCGVLFVMLARSKKNSESSDSVPPGNRRKEPRVPVTSEFDLFWQDVDASHKSARARGIEISEHGASVRSPRPILLNSVIQIRGCQVQFEGKATVRYCTKKGLSYVIGLQVEGQDAGGKFKTERLHA
jgi:hypothetical protein